MTKLTERNPFPLAVR